MTKILIYFDKLDVHDFT